MKSASERLAFFGLSQSEIDDLKQSGKVVDRVVIHSPADGVIMEKDVFRGQRISPGQTLFKVVDLSKIWILADVFKVDMPFMKLRSSVTVTYSDNQDIRGKS